MPLRSFRQRIKDAFAFSSAQRRALTLLLFVLVALLAARYVIRYRTPGNGTVRSEAFLREAEAFERQLASDTVRASRETAVRPARTGPAERLQPFDPNTADAVTWIAFGIPARLAGRIVSYRRAGGRFRAKEDLKKIYGFTETHYALVETYLVIPRDSASPPPRTPGAGFSAHKENKPVIDLNTATADDLIAVYGIGPVRARDILTYRDRLGGYVSPDQLLEVYGLDSTWYASQHERFTVKAKAWRRIDINSTNPDAFRHPYLTRRLSRLIMNYRAMHGPYGDVREIRNIEGIAGAEADRIIPYLSVE